MDARSDDDDAPPNRSQRERAADAAETPHPASGDAGSDAAAALEDLRGLSREFAAVLESQAGRAWNALRAAAFASIAGLVGLVVVTSFLLAAAASLFAGLRGGIAAASGSQWVADLSAGLIGLGAATLAGWWIARRCAGGGRAQRRAAQEGVERAQERLAEHGARLVRRSPGATLAGAFAVSALAAGLFAPLLALLPRHLLSALAAAQRSSAGEQPVEQREDDREPDDA